MEGLLIMGAFMVGVHFGWQIVDGMLARADERKRTREAQMRDVTPKGDA